MNAVVRLAVAFAAGAAAMYYFDPIAGRRRRALARDQGIAAGHDVEHLARAKAKRTADRLHGAAARRRARLRDEPVDDLRLHERIRSQLGHIVEYPGAVTVQVNDGHVVLTGTASEEEIEQLHEAVWALPGVDGLDNQLAIGNGAAAGTATATGQDARH